MNNIRLTQYGNGGGCSCKIPPGELEDLVAGLSPASSPSTAGAARNRSAATTRRCSRWTDAASAIVATTDFFPPVVDDPYDFGRIAATNALSDVYAVGGEPVLALNLLGWPRDVLPMELAREVLRGGSAMRPGSGLPSRRRATASTTPTPSTGWPSPASPTPAGCCAWTRADPAYPSR